MRAGCVHQLGASHIAVVGFEAHYAHVLDLAHIPVQHDRGYIVGLEQAIDDLMEVEDMTEERAGELIMTARAPWFEEESSEEEAEQA